MFWNSSQITGTPRMPRARHSADTQALLTHTWKAKWLAAYSL